MACIYGDLSRWGKGAQPPHPSSYGPDKKDTCPTAQRSKCFIEQVELHIGTQLQTKSRLELRILHVEEYRPTFY